MAFRSLYRHDYYEHPLIPTGDFDPFCAALFQTAKLNNIESIVDITIKNYSKEEADAFTKNRWKRFYQTTYRKAYCEKPVQSDKEISEGVMMSEMEKLFEGDKVKEVDLMPMVPTTERVMGFATKDQKRTPLTTYQSFHDRVGYFVIKTNKERIANKAADKNRLSVTDTTPRVKKSRSKSGDNVKTKKSNTSTSKVEKDTKQVFFLRPESDQSKKFTFEFDTKNKNVVQLE